MVGTAPKPATEPTGKMLRCRFGFHRWRDFRSADGEPYRKCTYCDKFLNTHKWERVQTRSEEAYRCRRCGKRRYGKLNDPNMGAMGAAAVAARSAISVVAAAGLAGDA